MTFLIVLTLTAIALSTTALISTVRHDRRGFRPPPVSHFEDRRFVSPLVW